jgi:hypothetical protein
MPTRPALTFALAVATGLIAGCGSDDETSSYKLVPVTGTVTLNGKPLEGAAVSFVPDGKNSPSTAGSDVTGPEGNYKLMFRGRSGVAAGKYTVKISKTILPTGAAVHEDVKEDPYMASLAAQSRAGTSKGKQAEAAPTVVEQSFEREVPAAGGVQDFDVKATTKAAAPKKAS